jgi:hypothetical protein
MEEQAPYETKPAGLFHALLTEPLKIWGWCPNCWVQTDQTFHHEDERFEYYLCEGCNRLHAIAVR